MLSCSTGLRCLRGRAAYSRGSGPCGGRELVGLVLIVPSFRVFVNRPPHFSTPHTACDCRWCVCVPHIQDTTVHLVGADCTVFSACDPSMGARPRVPELTVIVRVISIAQVTHGEEGCQH